MKKIINYLDVEKNSAEFIMLCYYGLLCLLQNIEIIIKGALVENKINFIMNLIITVLFIVYIVKEVKLVKTGKSKLLEKSKGWAKVYPIIMITVFIFSGIVAITSVVSGDVKNIATVLLDIISFGLAVLILVCTIINRFINKPKEEIKDEDNL